jgi:hypothetical protein
MRKHSAFFDGPEAIWDFVPNWNDFAELEGEIRCSTTIVFSPGLSGGQVKNLSLQKHSGLPLPAFLAVEFLTSTVHFD